MFESLFAFVGFPNVKLLSLVGVVELESTMISILSILKRFELLEVFKIPYLTLSDSSTRNVTVFNKVELVCISSPILNQLSPLSYGPITRR